MFIQMNDILIDESRWCPIVNRSRPIGISTTLQEANVGTSSLRIHYWNIAKLEPEGVASKPHAQPLPPVRREGGCLSP
jgi:hypothetical protein